MSEMSDGFNVENILPGVKQLRRASEFVKRIALLGTEVDLSTSEHIRRPGEVGAVPTIYDSANAIIN